MATNTSSTWQGWAKFAVAVAVLIALPHVLYPVFLAKVLCFALFAAAFNLLLGYAGLLSFGHAAFFGFAAYVSAHTAKEWGFTPELAIIAGTLVAAVLGVLMGLLAIRRQGIYFAMVTLALAQMVFFICVQAPFTHGEDGIQGVPRGYFLGLFSLESNFAIYYFVLAVFLIGVIIIHRTVHSPFGQVLKSIRENEPRAISLGYDADRYKLLAFILSATLAGMAGSTKVLVFKLASLTDVAWQMSGEVVLMTMLGGVGTMLGPIVGASIIVTMQNYLAEIGQLTLIIQGLVFVFCVLLFRRGIVGEIKHWWTRLRGGKDEPAHLGPSGSTGLSDGDAEAAHAQERAS
ncbi:branched-chain amino acid ABC transporter permease [Acuticoccus sediminis]|uniref:Branched-chain amino acid ABC transporter permease n=1 Tax=Acuticoccus sediminis TaxID=2184697 RepID=A0A8B2P1P9_9HYPH|nr:branched-chain amino acid ABC transporter permease [Acuticoccus sediminis]RAI04076.1 branched-chain amino acid ABC transporter permease [Acuticoccus sediminis]